MSRVYKILTAAQWETFNNAGTFKGAPIDQAEGFIHLSGPTQVSETARRYFSGQSGLWLVGLEVDKLGPGLKWERSRGGALFPHLYGRMEMDAVVEAKPLALDADGVPLATP